MNVPVIRPKSSHRKQRSSEPVRERPAPSQDRSRRRIEIILDATAKLLEHVNIEDLSHSDIADQAGISKASVHYYFPTIADLQFALGKRFDDEVCALFQAHHQHTTDEAPASWQEWARRDCRIPYNYFNGNRPACEALLGPILHRRNRLAGMQYNSRLSVLELDHLSKRFHLPPIPDINKVFGSYADIFDTFWSASYLSTGQIDEAALEESLRAAIGYLRNYLPDVLPTRTPGDEVAPD